MMASTTSRKSVMRGRPPGYTGKCGSISAHCLSEMSLGEDFVFMQLFQGFTPYGTVSK